MNFGDWVKSKKGIGIIVETNVRTVRWAMSFHTIVNAKKYTVLYPDDTVGYHHTSELQLIAQAMVQQRLCDISDGILTSKEAKKRGWCLACKRKQK